MQQPGGSPYGVPPTEMAPFSPPPPPGPAPRPHILGIPPAAAADQQMAEAASPISSRPPPPPPPAAAAGAPRSAGRGFEELVSGGGGGGGGGFPDEDALAGAADEAERGGGGGGAGNRWPKQETLALIKIRSEMDAAFREATLKGPLWEEVSRKLGELEYRRSAKKCKEKFENVHKYYKRTKENRAGRQDGKSYRFFSQLEALAAAGSSGSPAPATIGFAAAMAGPSAGRIVQPTPISAAAPPPPAIVTPVREIGHGSAIQGISGSTTPTTPAAAAVGGISFSTNSSEEEESDDTEEDEETEETGGQPHEHHGSKRKRKGGPGGGGGGGGSRKMMAFFEGLMKQVVERQEAMQQRFLETIEKREQDRMIREEAWRRQEMARLTREQELMAQERAMAASRDAAILSFIQRISGQTIQLPTIPATPISAAPAPPPPPVPAPQPQRQTQQPPPPQPVPPQPQPQPQREFRQQQQQQSTEIVLHQASTSSHDLVPVPDQQESAPGSAGFETASSSRWPKAEVHALISLRTGLDIKYQDAGPKGPLWEEISAEMKKLGYNRSSKRCKEKWENINKYFKKVKESSKRRPEDSKTCPYFHQLDALYRQKQQGIGVGGGHRPGDQEAYSHSNPQGQGNILSIMPPPPPPSSSSQPPILETEIKTDGGKKNGGSSDGNGGGSVGVEIQTSNGGLTPTLFEEGPAKKPEDIVKELMERRDAAAADDCDEADDSYNMDDEDEDDDDEEEEEDDDDEGSKMRYEIQFQRPSNVSGGGGGNPSTAAAANTTTTASAATTTAGSFLAMVQ